MLAAAWGSSLLVENRIYVGDEDGDINIFNPSAEQHEPSSGFNRLNPVYSTPIVANNVLGTC
ncbi:MAG: hypothetical protein GKR94_25870 [Gammaproteobacteria bacterium]|nr:hypothetical protein [Gammaproteobacteria bacterium]